MFKSEVDDEKITLIEKITLSSTEVLQQFSIFQVLFHFPFFQSPSPPKNTHITKKDFSTHIKNKKNMVKIFKLGKKKRYNPFSIKLSSTPKHKQFLVLFQVGLKYKKF